MVGSNLKCKGIIGDGCGGGREFYIQEETLYAFDPLTKQSLKLYEGIKEATNITKKGCNIYIETKTKNLVFNLSDLKMETV